MKVCNSSSGDRRPVFAERRRMLPHGPFVGSLEEITLCPARDKTFLSILTCVVFPAPSIPSTATRIPRVDLSGTMEDPKPNRRNTVGLSCFTDSFSTVERAGNDNFARKKSWGKILWKPLWKPWKKQLCHKMFQKCIMSHARAIGPNPPG